VLVFLAQDADSRAFCYSNADIRKGEERDEILNFVSFWKKTYGQLPGHLVFDSQLTTFANLARLDKMDITFITLRRRSPKLLAEIDELPRSAWRRTELDVPTRKYQTWCPNVVPKRGATRIGCKRGATRIGCKRGQTWCQTRCYSNRGYGMESGVCIGIRQVSGIFGHSERPGGMTVPATIKHLS
jgi:hypothetical protein